jgi:Protein of unknown function (DUF3298)/Deacetylase PdaC
MKMKSVNRFFPLVLIVALSFSAACRRQRTESASSTPTPNDQAGATAGGTITTGDTFHFRGTIAGNLKIEMTLLRDGERLSGSYFYPKVGKDIQLKGTIDKSNNLELRESDETGADTGVFKGRWKPSAVQPELDLAQIEGKWSRPDGSKQTAFDVTEQPIKFTGAQRIVPKLIKEAKKEAHYSIEAEYPQIEGGDPRFDKFNREARSMVTKQVAEWKTNQPENEAALTTELPPETGDSTMSIGYDIRYATDDLISVEFSHGEYSRGAAHPNSFTMVLNYDLRNGKKLALGDLFKPKSNYLSAISSFCIKSLKEQSKKKDLLLDDESIQSGAGPKADNYKDWAITRKGLWITFDAYQVGPYAAGPQYVMVPYSAIKDLVNPDGPLGAVTQ